MLVTRDLRACRESMLILKHTIFLITLGCRPHITSFCDLWVKCITSQHVTHKAETAVWAAPDVLNRFGAFPDRLLSPLSSLIKMKKGGLI